MRRKNKEETKRLERERKTEHKWEGERRKKSQEKEWESERVSTVGAIFRELQLFAHLGPTSRSSFTSSFNHP